MAREERTGSASSQPICGELFAERYRIEAHVGEGGMGSVYRGRDEVLDETVALKVLTLSQGVKPEQLERFQREVRLARRITHPNVVRTHDIGRVGDVHFLTMEFIEGETLESRCRRLLPIGQAVAVAIAVADALAAAHAAHVVHRDLKPANVLIEKGGRVVVTDFGVARCVASVGAQPSRVIGTPLYMAPEQVLGESVDVRTDIYALGLLMYEMLTGRLPFEADSPMASALVRCHRPPVDAREYGLLDSALASLIMRCIALRPADRPAQAAEVAAALRGSGVALQAVQFDPQAATMDLGPAMTTGPTISVATGMPSTLSVPSAALTNSLRPFAPLAPAARSLAVLPFEARGDAEHAYLAQSLPQELVDVLSKTRGLRVLAFGATRAADPTEDPRQLGLRLGADAIVSGTVTVSRGRVRVAARLLDVGSGHQIWSDTLERGFEDVIAMQDIVSRRVAEALRGELTVDASRATVTAEAIELYLRGRRELASGDAFFALENLQKCLQLEPEFKPALAAAALAAVKAWWAEALEDRGKIRDEDAKAAVALALAKAPDVPETHFAAARYALQHGDLRTTAHELASTLEAAPTFADAHSYLGDLQCEAGRVDEGVKRLELAYELHPASFDAPYAIARVSALRGDWAAYDKWLVVAAKNAGPGHFATTLLEARVAGWRRDMAAVREIRDRVKTSPLPNEQFLAGHLSYVLGEVDRPTGGDAVQSLKRFNNPRLLSIVNQVTSEACCLRGDLDLGMRHLQASAEGTLVDLEWVLRCPAIEPLRSRPEFLAVVRTVKARAEQIWRA